MTLPTLAPSAERIGYQPTIDGLRALSVVAVVLYHTGFGWMRGGFLGVEVFFVVSGFLITTLLIEEHAAHGAVSVRQFWLRRARRLLPALVALLVAVALWAIVAGTPEQAAQVRADLPWALLYSANWGQILGDQAYFAALDPPLLRHLWSLAVEEQWYVLWPLAFVVLVRLTRRPVATGAGLLALAAAVSAAVWWVGAGVEPFAGLDRVNVLYLSTVTRSVGLLVGAAAAFWWRSVRDRAPRHDSLVIDSVAALALGVLAGAFVGGNLTAAVTYPWTMAAVSLASAIVVLAAIHPTAVGTRQVLGTSVLAALGRRSYGIYLWHWPVFVVVGATTGSWWRFALGVLAAGALSELCYRFVEMPIRRGALSRLWTRRRAYVLVPATTLGAVASIIAVGIVRIEPFDAAVGGDDVAFEIDTAESPPATVAAAPVTTVAPHAEPATTDAVSPNWSTTIATASTTTVNTTTVSTTVPVLPRSVAIVGDSQAHSLAVNLPDGIDPYFSITNGAVSGCSVHDEGIVTSAYPGFANDFSICEGWQFDWARAASEHDVALVVLGAWDVLDIVVDGERHVFGSASFDRLFARRLREGLDVLRAAGAHAVLLEVPCMRPVDASGARVPPLPERGDDARVAHLNVLLRRAAARDSDHVTFIEGPAEWCAPFEPIATDVDYRWDGVHVYKPGAKLIFETIAPALLAVPVERSDEAELSATGTAP